jgi:hypothetical protein
MSELTPDNFWSILHAMPEPMTVSHRLYYDNAGNLIMYSMEDLPGNYIQVDPATYALAPANVRVVDKKIIYIKPAITVKKLQPNNSNGTTCDPRDVCVVVRPDQEHTKWSIKTNETN